MRMSAFIDEAGDRACKPKSSAYFVMSAVVVKDADFGETAKLLASLRRDLHRGPREELHWRMIKKHAQQVHVAKQLGGATTLTISSVVICKRCCDGTEWQATESLYLETFRYLLERLSWMARDAHAEMTYMLAHVKHFKLATLRAYEARLRAEETKIAWAALDHKGAQVDQPGRIEQLQLADLAASATFQAFEPDHYGNTEQRYLRDLASRLYRRKGAALTSYGLKIYPWNDETQGLHPWVSEV